MNASTSWPPSPDAILAGLDPEQRQVATYAGSHLCVLAGAGTGKTRAITHRIAYGVLSGHFDSRRVLAVTFTARAAQELRTRLADLGVPGVAARTFHSAALRQLGYFWPKVMGGVMPEIVTHKAGIIAQAAKRSGLSVDPAMIRDLASEIEWSKVTMIRPDQYAKRAAAAGRSALNGADHRVVGRVIEAYEGLKVEQRVIDFEDVLLLMAGLMQEHPEVARTVHEQYRHLVIDEYQDVSFVQHTLVNHWLGERGTLCVVGDAGQTIYSFAGASAQYLTNFARSYPGAATISLVRNYRCTKEIVTLANSVLAAAPASYRTAHVQLQAQDVSGEPTTIHGFANDEEEARWVARDIARVVEAGMNPADIAVLYRIRAQSEPFEQALTDAHVAFRVRDGEQFFARPEVRQAIQTLRGGNAIGVYEPGSMATEVRAMLAGLGWSAKAPEHAGAVRSRWESMQALVDIADRITLARPAATLTDLLTELDERRNTQHAPTVRGVTLSSLHAAKGLEWQRVYLVGCAEGLLPYALAKTPDAVEEERRLCYVGVTRARRDLVITWAASRNADGRGSRSVSRFLAGSAAAKHSTSQSPSRAWVQRTVPRCRVCNAVLDSASERTLGRCGQCPAAYDEAVYSRLRAWRTGRAKQLKKPPFVIVTDATLQVAAENLPSDMTELMQVPGIAAVKAEQYGQEILDLLAGADVSEVLARTAESGS